MSRIKDLFWDKQKLEFADVQAELDYLRETKKEQIIDTIESLIRAETDKGKVDILADLVDRISNL